MPEGTDTVMMLVPCGTTCASVKPALFTRLNMIDCAVAIWASVTFDPCTGTAASDTRFSVRVCSRLQFAFESRSNLAPLTLPASLGWFTVGCFGSTIW